MISTNGISSVFEKLPALTKSNARRAFDQCEKDKINIFYQHRDEAFLVENAHLLRSADFDSEDDVYLFDTAGKWIYIHTHELQCGPYFYQIK